MDDHGFFLAALLALMAVIQSGQHSVQIDRFVDQLASEPHQTVQPVCSNVELTVACVPVTDMLSADTPTASSVWRLD